MGPPTGTGPSLVVEANRVSVGSPLGVGVAQGHRQLVGSSSIKRSTVDQFEARLMVLLRRLGVLDLVEHDGGQTRATVLLLPALASNASVGPAHPVVVQPVRWLSTVVPRVALVPPLATPSHGAASSTALAARARVEPAVDVVAVPVPVHEYWMRRKDGLEAMEQGDGLRRHLRSDVIASHVLDMHDVEETS